MGLLLYASFSINSASAMPAIMTTDQLVPGMRGYAETVIQGNSKVTFNVEVIGVVNGKSAGKQILARASGDVINQTNGVIHGMSGSPVYVNGKLIGAVARAVGEDVLPYNFYITPIEDMLKIWEMPDPLASVNKSNIKPVKVLTAEEYDKKEKSYDEDIDKEVSKYKSKHLATPEGEKREKGKAQKRLEEILQEAEVQESKEDVEQTTVEDRQTDKIIEKLEGKKDDSNEDFEQLSKHVSLTKFILSSIEKSTENNTMVNNPTNVYVSGFSANSLNYLKHNLAKNNIVPYEAGTFVSSATGSSESDIKANATLSEGDPVGVVMVYGDFTAGGTGTVTAVDGNKILAFGHPMAYKGNVNFFMTDANIVGSAGGLLNGMKVGYFGKIIGRINQDRFSGISGILNSYPTSVPVRVTVSDKNLGITNHYTSKVAYDEDILTSLIPSIAYAAMDRTADRSAYGTAKVKFAIKTDEVPEGVFERENIFYDAKDVGQFAVGELTQAILFLSTNIDKPSNILDVKVDINFSSGRNTASIVSAIPDKPEVKPGEKVIFKVTLKPYRRESVVIDVPYTIPKTQKEGPMSFEVRGGGFIQVSELLQSGLVVTAQDAGQLTTADRLKDLKNLSKNNELVISPTVDITSEADQAKAIKEAIKLSEEISKMSPKEREELNKNRESKVSTDYVIDNYIQATVNIKK